MNKFLLAALLCLPTAVMAAEVKDYTVLVFKNAKNNLEDFGLLDMNEMELAGSSDRVNVLVEFGRIKGGYAGRIGEDWGGARRYYVIRDADPSVINSPVVWERAAVDMGDWRELADFLAWGKARYPAKKYLLVIWNHGNGWKGKAAGARARGISFDDETGNHISTPELEKVFAQAGPVDVLAFDACLMQTVEVAYEVRRHAAIVAGSEETEPGEGYPYDAIIGALNSDPGMSPERLGAAIVAAYRDRNEAAYMDTTQSAVRTAALDGLRRRLDEWARAAAASDDAVAVKRAFLAAHGFYEIDQKDLADLLRLTAEGARDASLKAASLEALRWLREEVVAANGVSGYAHRPARGLAVYAPPRYSYDDGYGGLAWARDGLWDDFISGSLAGGEEK
ncbi:MAG: hypothetical protein A2049_02020 [Elusimicrobia bacterium GWA2_62_23]|nr:MAG: hypothetical protein A2049_02020 [Elusimicrobia bacterium GWA2_62_23]OGR72113.1 MAG: hypothetical protein A2179_02045 [Elusimicrobia bacterium GWC2_63_65]